MKLSQAVKPISYVKTHASEIIRDIEAGGGRVIITLNGEAKAVIQGITEYEELQESLALLKILAQSKKCLEEGKYKPAAKAFKDLRKKWATAR
jgi:prevent-host-death family protein